MNAFPLWQGSRREFLTAAGAGAAALLAGCGRPAMPGKRVTLTQWYHQYGEEGTQQAVQRYADEYMRLHPDIGIQVVWVPGDYGTKLSTALLTRGGPDIFESSSLTVAMVEAGQVAALDDLFPPGVRRDFPARDLAMNSVGGKVYGVKMLDDAGILYYRPSLLRAAGLGPPQTMDELIRASKKLSTGSRKGLFVGNDGGVYALISIAPWSAGCDFLVDNMIVFNTPRTALAYEKVRELNESGSLLIGAPTDWWDPSALTQGLAAMQWGGLWSYPAIKKALGDDVGGMAWPALDAAGRPATFLGGWSAMVNAQGPQVAEAKNYVRWLWVENKRLQQDWCLSYGFHVPPRESVARTATALHAPVPALAVADLAAYGQILPTTWNAAMGTALTDAMTNILKQGRPAAAEVQAAAEKCERELRRALE